MYTLGWRCTIDQKGMWYKADWYSTQHVSNRIGREILYHFYIRGKRTEIRDWVKGEDRSIMGLEAFGTGGGVKGKIVLLESIWKGFRFSLGCQSEVIFCYYKTWVFWKDAHVTISSKWTYMLTNSHGLYLENLVFRLLEYLKLECYGVSQKTAVRIFFQALRSIQC